MDTSLLHLDALIANGYRGRKGDLRNFAKGVSQATRDHERAFAAPMSTRPGNNRAIVRELIYWAHYYAVQIPHFTLIY